MFTKNIFFLLLITISGSYSQKLKKLSDVYVRNLQLSPCDSRAVSSISVQNVQVQIGENKRFIVSGTMRTTEDLTAPLTASVILKKKVTFAWIKIPCEKNMGSCTYNDLCSYGYPISQQCPSEFTNNGIPCRCPFPRGNYTIPVTEIEFPEDRSVITGKYKGSVTIHDSLKQLTCYNLSFALQKK